MPHDRAVRRGLLPWLRQLPGHPYAMILGAREEYGYHCQACQITWRVLVHDGSAPVVSKTSPAA
jgi:hypothetical protein